MRYNRGIVRDCLIQWGRLYTGSMRLNVEKMLIEFVENVNEHGKKSVSFDLVSPPTCRQSRTNIFV